MSVTKQSIRHDGLVGVLATPSGTDPAPGVLLVGGSEGGLHERDAETLAGAPGPPMTSTTSPGPGVIFEMGGTPASNTAARAEAWQLTVDFFREHLR